MKIKTKLTVLVVLLTGVASNVYGGVAEITDIKGSVEIQRPPAEEWEKVSLSTDLESGDRLRTGPAGSATVNFNAGHTAHLGPDSTIDIKDATEDNTELKLFKGNIRSKVKKLSRKQDYKISTPQAVCAVRGTDFEVSVLDNRTGVKVFEGVVEARQMVTGEAVNVVAGEYSNILEGKKPTEPEQIEEIEEEKKAGSATAEGASLQNNSIRKEIRSEMFEEISRDVVLSRAAEEIKRAEYENGKAMIDAHGNRVRLEEYVVRPAGIKNEFKYVVLNKRDNRFDFGKINFTFNSALPDDLTLATKEMFYSEATTKPDWILTKLTSVMSNTQDRVNEVATGGGMLADAGGNWNHYFAKYKFSIKGKDRDELILWTRDASNIRGSYENISWETYYLDDKDNTELESEVTTRPAGDDSFHIYTKDTYSDGTWISADDYLINNEGEIQSSDDFKDNFSSELGGGFKDYLAKLNFERKYESSEFEGRDIDLVFSTKLLLDSDMISMGIEKQE